MFYNIGFEMSGDHILTAAQELLDQQPSAEVLDRELAEQLRLAEVTQQQLRADIRQLVNEYRIWRRDARCGRAATNMQPANLPMLKQIRAAFATYRLTQILLRDMREIALFDTVQPVKIKAVNKPIPTINPVIETPTPANDQTEATIDGILYEELESKYGPSIAQKLYDELKKAEEINRKLTSAVKPDNLN